ncbi:MAG: acetyl-CoA hydrolase/transferase C-terminal domain-containing protein [Syntrophomonadaceae bacterium]|nr:acetyl-CoA hydrolase/transferase C-terminal domain-containing protein [Syntrophomonadaceae bacterium]
MTSPIQQKIRDKTISAKQFAEMVKPGDWLLAGTAAGDATACMEAVAQRLGPGPADLKDIELWCYASYFSQPWWQEMDPQQKYHCIHEFFYFPWNRKARDKNGVTSWAHWGWAMGMWFHHYRFYNEVKSKRGIDWWVNAVSPSDHRGFFNLSYGTNNGIVFKETAKKTVLEVRQDYPWAEGGANNVINIDEVDYIVEVDCDKYRWPQMDESKIVPTPEEVAIANHVLTLIDDRDCIQLGIGSLPSAVVIGLKDAGLKNLGVHTEMLNSGLMTLIESGQVTNLFKNIDRGRSVWTFAFPFDDKKYYDFVHHNMELAVYDEDYTNNIVQLSRIDNMVAINNFVAIDLYGQICCGHFDGRPISGSGGIFNFISFCAVSKGGRGIAAATSRSKHQTSRIIPQLPPGSVVDVPAQLVSWVCTEYGMVNLRGLNGYERTEAIISIAHPDDREWLREEAYKLSLLPKHFPVSMKVTETGSRRYPDHMKERKEYKIPYTSRMWGHDYLGPDGIISGK